MNAFRTVYAAAVLTTKHHILVSATCRSLPPSAQQRPEQVGAQDPHCQQNTSGIQLSMQSFTLSGSVAYF